MPINSFLYPSKNVPVPYEVNNSCRFFSNTRLHKTPSSTGSNSVATFSCWVKRSGLGILSPLFSADPVGGGGAYGQIVFSVADKLNVYDGGTVIATTNRVFRDVSSWYNIVVALNSGASGTDKCKIYVNGTLETSFSTDNRSSFSNLNGWNQNTVQNVGSDTVGFLHGYMAEVVMIDGTQYAASDFGEFDDDSPTIWKPKDVSGLTFGTNGFYLDFEDSGNLGNDVNGGTDLTEVNLSAVDQATDTPTNNFCVMNPLDYTATTFSEGNLKLNWSQSPNVFGITTGTLFMGSGKYYWEAKITSDDDSTGIQLGVIQVEPYLSRLTAPGVDLSLFFGLGARFRTDKAVNKVLNGTDSSISDTWSNDVIIRIAYDGSAGKIYMWTGTSELTGQDISAGTSFNNGTLTSGTMVLPYLSLGDGGSGTKTCQIEFNFGGCPAFSISSGNSDANGYGNFEYSVPSGYYSLCTKNLAEFG
jgi:hypothetical protein|tara:strand:+ start:625 stop:2040 length:1416 start_codon:yes stop_codon:yes gene_type:complete